ncbi:MAG: GPW/gp25 family protein [Planctomycetaceae bacterium]|nr:GPW/gp25 family protein [Planctomycetaceae bacterium]
MSTRMLHDVAPAGLLDRLCLEAVPVDSPEDYRAAVLADLQDLLGTIRHWSSEELADHGEVEASVINYGIAPLTGRVITGDAADQLAAEIRSTILRFDGRFEPASLEVTSMVDPDRTSLDALTLRLEGRLRGFPKPIPFLARATANLETGILVLTAEGAAP